MIRKVKPRTATHTAVQWAADSQRDAGEFASTLAIASIPFQIMPDRRVTVWQGQETFPVDDRSWVVITAVGKCKVMGNAEFTNDYEVVYDD